MASKRLAITFISMMLGFLLFIGAKSLLGATCTGADPCHACKNCKYCKHCAKEGGTCGICKKNGVAGEHKIGAPGRDGTFADGMVADPLVRKSSAYGSSVGSGTARTIVDAPVEVLKFHGLSLGA
jgi:hypothetical protein